MTLMRASRTFDERKTKIKEYKKGKKTEKMLNYRTKKGRAVLEENINGYFEMCDRLNSADEKKPAKPYTLSGLLCYIGLSEDELSEMCSVRRIEKLVNAAKLRIESYIEENALNGKLSATAAVNSLKAHFGWNDKSPKDDPPQSFSVMLDSESDKLGE